MFDTSGDVYSYIAFAIVSLHVLYPLPSNIMHKCDKIIKSFKYIIAKIHQIPLQECHCLASKNGVGHNGDAQGHGPNLRTTHSIIFIKKIRVISFIVGLADT